MKKLVIYRIGSLGDTVVALPSFVTIRDAHLDYDITLLCNDDKKGSLRFYHQLVVATGLVNKVVSYHSSANNMNRLISFLWALLKVRLSGCKTFYYLMPSQRNFKSEQRDNLILKIFFFSSIKGIRENNSVDKSDSEVKRLLKRTQLPLDVSREKVFKSLTQSVTESEDIQINQMFYEQKNAGDFLYGIAPGTAQPNHLWPAENFLKLIKELKRVYNAKPIIFGGPAERNFFEKISAEIDGIQFINHTYSIQVQLLMMKRCDFFISNNTGSIHLASLAGSPAIGLYSHPMDVRPWFPAWGNHRILQKKEACTECPGALCVSDCPCINNIKVEEVLAAVGKVIKETRAR